MFRQGGDPMNPGKIMGTSRPGESLDCRVVVVRGGPGGLSPAIRLKQLAAAKGQDVSVVVLEKGGEPGAHILSGAIMDPKALTELLPNWKELGAPLNQPVTDDAWSFLSETSALRTPNMLLPECAQNHGNYIITLSNFTRWLAQQAENLGAEIFPALTASAVRNTDDGSGNGGLPWVKGAPPDNMGQG